jgi:hypothetical protein
MKNAADIFLDGLDLMSECLDAGEQVGAIDQILILLSESASEI